MVYAVKSGPSEYQYIARPDRSLTWKEASFVYAGMVTLILGIGISCFSLGLTLVLPFSGIEIIALGAGFYVCLARGECQEVVSINKDKVVVERGRHKLIQRYEFQRYWVRLIIESPGNVWYPTQIKFRSHGREVEIGAFLSEADRQRLAKDLSHVLQNL